MKQMTPRGSISSGRRTGESRSAGTQVRLQMSDRAANGTLRVRPKLATTRGWNRAGRCNEGASCRTGFRADGRLRACGAVSVWSLG